MNKMTFVKGMGLGVVVGSVIGMVASPKKKKSSVGKAIKTMGDVVESITDSIGM